MSNLEETWQPAKPIKTNFLSPLKDNSIFGVSGDLNTLFLSGIWKAETKTYLDGLSLSNKSANTWDLPQKMQLLTHPYSWTEVGYENISNFTKLIKERNENNE